MLLSHPLPHHPQSRARFLTAFLTQAPHLLPPSFSMIMRTHHSRTLSHSSHCTLSPRQGVPLRHGMARIIKLLWQVLAAVSAPAPTCACMWTRKSCLELRKHERATSRSSPCSAHPAQGRPFLGTAMSMISMRENRPSGLSRSNL
jgi:hypothetical protein